MPFIEDLEKAEKWLGENENKLKLLGSNGKKIHEALASMLDGGETGMVKQLTGFSDVDEILKQAGGVDEVIKSSGIDVEKLLEEKNIKGIRVKDIILENGEFTITTCNI